MEVILLESIRSLGELGELVNVKPGYARNYLIPQKKAVFATEGAKARVEERRRELAKLEEQRVESAKARAVLIAEEITLTRKAGEEGHLFGSVSAADIAEALTTNDAEVHRSEVAMPSAIKELGRYEIDIIFHADVQKTVMVNVLAEE
jgi:large subunit ribosomal protein L9